MVSACGPRSGVSLIWEDVVDVKGCPDDVSGFRTFGTRNATSY